MADTEFWVDRKRAEGKAKELADIKRELERWKKTEEELESIKEIAEIAEGDKALQKELTEKIISLEKTLFSVERERFLSGKYDKGSAVLAVYAGAGGKDAEDWVSIPLWRKTRMEGKNSPRTLGRTFGPRRMGD
jgi:peptide chain release factor 2